MLAVSCIYACSLRMGDLLQKVRKNCRKEGKAREKLLPPLLASLRMSSKSLSYIAIEDSSMSMALLLSLSANFKTSSKFTVSFSDLLSSSTENLPYSSPKTLSSPFLIFVSLTP
ncbi:hypothetical protein SLE2022_343400 [Rubroshorea leprosula]